MSRTSRTITIVACVAVAARLAFGQAPAAPAPPRGGPGPLRVMASAATPDQPPPMMNFGNETGLIAEDGTFELRGGLGPVLFRVSTPRQWSLKSVTLDGDNITDIPVDLKNGEQLELRVVVTDKLTDISGGVSNGRAQSLKDYVVVVQPAEPLPASVAARFTRSARPDQDGRFRVRGMPPGRYIATAVEALEQGREWDPEYQPKLREAEKAFSIREGESVVLDLTLAEGL